MMEGVDRVGRWCFLTSRLRDGKEIYRLSAGSYEASRFGGSGGLRDLVVSSLMVWLT